MCILWKLNKIALGTEQKRLDNGVCIDLFIAVELATKVTFSISQSNQIIVKP